MAKITISEEENFNFSVIQNAIELADALNLVFKVCNLNPKHKATLALVATFKYHQTISNKCSLCDVNGGKMYLDLYPEIKDIEFNIVPEYLPTEIYLA